MRSLNKYLRVVSYLILAIYIATITVSVSHAEPTPTSTPTPVGGPYPSAPPAQRLPTPQEAERKADAEAKSAEDCNKLGKMWLFHADPEGVGQGYAICGDINSSAPFTICDFFARQFSIASRGLICTDFLEGILWDTGGGTYNPANKAEPFTGTEKVTEPFSYAQVTCPKHNKTIEFDKCEIVKATSEEAICTGSYQNSATLACYKSIWPQPNYKESAKAYKAIPSVFCIAYDKDAGICRALVSKGGFSTFNYYLGYVYKMGFRIGAIIGILVFIVAGLMYSVSGLDSDLRKTAQNLIISVISGMALLAFIGLLLRLINPTFFT